MTFKISEYEAEARELFQDIPTTSHNAIIAAVFRAKWHQAISVERIERIGRALFELEEVDLQAALSKLVRTKVLRSYRYRGRRVYEVNFKA